MLSKSPPNLSLRRLKEEKRLQPRYFVLTKRSLTYPDSSPHCAPLGTVPLGAIVLCEPKGGGKHAGKFYLHTVSREFSLVAPSADEMGEWVDAINAARAALNDPLRRRSTASRTRARPPPRRRSRRRRRPRCRRSRGGGGGGGVGPRAGGSAGRRSRRRRDGARARSRASSRRRSRWRSSSMSRRCSRRPTAAPRPSPPPSTPSPPPSRRAATCSTGI